jgi:hypothetical protein
MAVLSGFLWVRMFVGLTNSSGLPTLYPQHHRPTYEHRNRRFFGNFMGSNALEKQQAL